MYSNLEYKTKGFKISKQSNQDNVPIVINTRVVSHEISCKAEKDEHIKRR